VHHVTAIPGDGIGPEVMQATMRVLEASGVEFEWDVQHAGAASLVREGTALPARVVDSIRERGVALKGPISTPVGQGIRSANLELRELLGLHAGIRPCTAYRGAPTPFAKTDFVVVRMLAGDLYAGIEYDRDDSATVGLRSMIADTGRAKLDDDVGISIKPISASTSRQVARTAFEYALATGRSKVTAVHKATVMRSTDGLFLATVREVGRREYPQVELDDGLVDSVCHRLVTRPEELDVLVLPMLYGDIISDIGAGLIGGLGMAPGANVGEDCAVFEAVHGSAPRHTGHNSANPLGLVLSGALLLRHLDEPEAATRVERAVAAVVESGERVTADLMPADDRSGRWGTSDVADAVIAQLRSA
jgi:isocitrate dehydrogenase (NAD+)